MHIGACTGSMLPQLVALLSLSSSILPITIYLRPDRLEGTMSTMDSVSGEPLKRNRPRRWADAPPAPSSQPSLASARLARGRPSQVLTPAGRGVAVSERFSGGKGGVAVVAEEGAPLEEWPLLPACCSCDSIRCGVMHLSSAATSPLEYAPEHGLPLAAALSVARVPEKEASLLARRPSVAWPWRLTCRQARRTVGPLLDPHVLIPTGGCRGEGAAPRARPHPVRNTASRGGDQLMRYSMIRDNTFKPSERKVWDSYSNQTGAVISSKLGLKDPPLLLPAPPAPLRPMPPTPPPLLPPFPASHVAPSSGRRAPPDPPRRPPDRHGHLSAGAETCQRGGESESTIAMIGGGTAATTACKG